MKKKYWMLIIIMFLVTLLIPVLQIMNISRAIPVDNQINQVSSEAMVASDMSQNLVVGIGNNLSIIILDGAITVVIISFGMNIFADYVFNKENSIELEQDSRLRIYNVIKENQGIHLREICRKLDKKMGVIQYHIHVLEKANLIDSLKEGRYRRFFIHNDNGVNQKIVMCFLQRESSRKILEYLLFNEDKTSHGELAEFLGISSQAITWHMKKLEGKGVVTFEKCGKQKYYMLTDLFEDIVRSELV